MITLILIISALILLAGLIVVVNPNMILGYISKHQDTLGMFIAAIVSRLLIGILLISESQHSSSPFAINSIGWISIIAALAFAIMWRKNFTRLLSWTLKSMNRFWRISGISAIVLGGFLIYAFI